MILNGDAEWLWAAAIVAFLAVLVVWWSYRAVSSPRGVRWACAALKAAGFILLAALLFEPLWSGVRARPGANLFLVLADNSRSLGVRDAGAHGTRGESLKALLTDRPAAWQVRLEQDFDVRRYRFDAGVLQVDGFSDLGFTGTASRLHGALATLSERFRGRPVAGILLLTDGNATDATAALDMAGLPPVYAVPLGTAEAQPDIAIRQVAVSQTAFEDAPVTVQAAVDATGFEGQALVARILDSDGKVMAEATQPAPAAEEHALTFRFQLRPTQPGLSFYTLDVAAQAEADAAGTTAAEATPENNRRMLRIDRGSGRKRVLYVSGRPNWEYKFLARAIEDDADLELAALIRIARREAKFDFRGRAGESSNPLFRGFKQAADAETESYDEPVIVRLGMRDGEELLGGFPKRAEDLFRFHAIILDDLEAGFFSQDQLELLERFVSERGGGLLMLGGQESFGHGAYAHTAVARLLPVYLDGDDSRRAEFHSVRQATGRSGTPSYGPAAAGMYRMLLSRDGWLQPWTRLRPTESEERQRLEEMPEFQTLNLTGGTKPGAVVLAEALDGAGQRQPALVVQRYGHGRTAALLIGDLWRWQLRRQDNSDDHGKAWRQAVRWLVADVPEPVTVTTLPTADASPGAVRLRVKTLDPDFEPLDNASVVLTVHRPDGEPLTLPAEPSLEEPGVFEAVCSAREPGAFRVVATVTDGNGQAAGTAETGWVAEPAADEFRTVTPDRKLLERLARETGGQVIEPDDLDHFVSSLPASAVPITERWTYPLWHQAGVFALAMACLVGEWGLRRTKGLP